MKETVLFLDDSGTSVPKEKATRFVLFVTDDNNRLIKESFGKVN
jgi:hypothetical protein